MAWIDRGFGVIVDENQDVEGIHEDGHDGDVSGYALLNDDVLNVADVETVKLGEGEEGSCVRGAILMAWELA